MKRLVHACLLGAVIFIAAIALIRPIGVSAASCFNDGAGSGPNGPLYSQFWLNLDYIHDSHWSGDNSYYAQRRFSGGGLSYNEFVSSGPHRYGTSGNAYRRTTIDNAGTVNYSWSETQYHLC
jgi:hypothetical protein